MTREREREGKRERASCEVEAEMWHLKVVDEIDVFLVFFIAGVNG